MDTRLLLGGLRNEIMIPTGLIPEWRPAVKLEGGAAASESHAHDGKCRENLACLYFVMGVDCPENCPNVPCENTMYADGFRAVAVEEDLDLMKVTIAEDVTKGTQIGEFNGLVVEVKHYRKLAKKAIARKLGWLSAVDYINGEKFALVAREFGNWTRLLVQSCQPNLKAITKMGEEKNPAVRLIAERDIRAGEVLTVNFVAHACNNGVVEECYCELHEQNGESEHEDSVEGDNSEEETENLEHELGGRIEDELDDEGESSATSEEEPVDPEDEDDNDGEEAEGVRDEEIPVVDLEEESVEAAPTAGPSRLACQVRREGVIKWVKDGEVKSVDLNSLPRIRKATVERESSLEATANDQRKKLRPRPRTEKQSAGSASVTAQVEPKPNTSGKGKKSTEKKPEFECDICKKRFPQHYRLVRHSLTHKESNFVCEKCGYRYRSMKILNFHRQRFHAPNKGPKCSKCGLVLSSRKNLVRHMKVHENYKRYRCEICGSKFSRADARNKHVRVQHANAKK